MPKTPGMMNPLTYSSDDELRKDLQKQGEEFGWTPLDSDYQAPDVGSKEQE